MKNEVRADRLLGDIIGTDNGNDGCFGVVPEVDFTDRLAIDPAVLRNFDAGELNGFGCLEGEGIFPVVNGVIDFFLKFLLFD